MRSKPNFLDCFAVVAVVIVNIVVVNIVVVIYL